MTGPLVDHPAVNCPNSVASGVRLMMRSTCSSEQLTLSAAASRPNGRRPDPLAQTPTPTLSHDWS
jgi:hypothetical protein